MTSNVSSSLEHVSCTYCGSDTTSFKLVSQILSNCCPTSFVTSEILSISGNLLKNDDKICSNHQDCFRIKYLQFKRGLQFTRKFRNDRADDTSKFCVICKTSNSYHFYQIHTVKTASLKDFIINQIHLEGKIVTRKGSGITENDHLCNKCYKLIKNQKLEKYRSPKKKVKSAIQIKEETTCSSESKPECSSTTRALCIVCSRTKQGAWRKVEGVIAKWINQVESEDFLKEKESEFIHRSCCNKLRTRVREITKCIICNSKFGNENSVLVVPSVENAILEKWISKNDVNPKSY